MRFRDLLRGADPEAQAALGRFFAGIETERLLWYPSAGTDYRDLLEMTAARRARHHIDTVPTIVCHTDYSVRGARLDDQVLHRDRWTTVEVIEKHRLFIAEAARVNYFVDESFVNFPDDAAPEPTVFLLNLRVTSHVLGVIDATVFYFLFENHNFLDQVVLKHRLPVTHFVKVREGCGFGGNLQSITVFYSLLGHLGTEVLLVDWEIHFCRELHDELALRHGIRHPAFRLEHLADVGRWSGFHVKAFAVHRERGDLTPESLVTVLRQIAGDTAHLFDERRPPREQLRPGRGPRRCR